MHSLSAVGLLDVWDYGLSRSPAQRAMELLAVAYPDTSWDSLAALSIGQRDAKLLALREELWGPRMAAVVACPGCQKRLDLPLDTREILSASPSEPVNEISLSVAGFNVTSRLPTAVDVADAASRAADPETCRALLVQNCLLSARQGDMPIDCEQLPPEVIAGLAEHMAEVDPLAEINMALHCPSCQQRWHATFDIASFLWTEIETWAWRVLTDVHTLARAYGWREGDVLNLSPRRRQFYLEMVGA